MFYLIQNYVWISIPYQGIESCIISSLFKESKLGYKYKIAPNNLTKNKTANTYNIQKNLAFHWVKTATKRLELDEQIPPVE